MAAELEKARRQPSEAIDTLSRGFVLRDAGVVSVHTEITDVRQREGEVVGWSDFRDGMSPRKLAAPHCRG